MQAEDQLIDAMLLLKKVLRRERLYKLLVVGIAFGLAMGLCFYLYLNPNSNIYAIFAILALGSIVAGLLFLNQVLKQWAPEKTALYLTLEKKPKNIVWVFMLKVEMMPFGVKFWDESTLFLCLLNGENLQLRAKTTEINQIETTLRTLLPHASFGYSKEKAQWFEANPMLLLKDENKD